MQEYKSNFVSNLEDRFVQTATIFVSYVALKGPEMLQEPAQRVIGLLRDFESKDPMYTINNKEPQK